MTRIRKRVITAGLVAVLALAVFAAPAYAYFTDVLRASGQQAIELGYSSEITEEHKDPHDSISDKVIAIKNLGDTEIMGRVFVSDAMDGVKVTVIPSSNDWYSQKTDGGTLWIYKRVISPKGGAHDKSSDLNVQVTATEGYDEDYPEFDIVVTGQTSPVAYDENNKAYAYAWGNSAEM